MVTTSPIKRESILLSTVSRSIRAGTQYEPEAGSRPIRLPRIRGSLTIGLRRCSPNPTADGDSPSRLPVSVVLRTTASCIRIRSEPMPTG
jgi:hypothetical protein